MKNNSSVMDTNDNKLNWVIETISNNYSSFNSVITSIEGNNTYIYAVEYETSSISNSEAFITKWNTDGSLVWQRKIGENSNIMFNSITTSIEGNNVFIYAVGYECSSTSSNFGAFITKWDVNGTLVWQRKISGNINDLFYSVTTSVEENNVYIYAVGYSCSHIVECKGFITKWDINGSLVWQKKIDKYKRNNFYSVTTSNEGSNTYIYAVGYKHSSASNRNAFITKWNTDGTLIWQKIIGGSYSNLFYSVTTSNEGSNTYIYAVGYEYSSTGSNSEAFITKWDVNGTLIWQKKIGGNKNDGFTSITSSIEENNVYLYAVGYESSSTNSNYSKAFITKWDVNGTLIWQKKIDGNNNIGLTLVTTSNEESNIYMYAVGYKGLFANIEEAIITKCNTNSIKDLDQFSIAPDLSLNTTAFTVSNTSLPVSDSSSLVLDDSVEIFDTSLPVSNSNIITAFSTY